MDLDDAVETLAARIECPVVLYDSALRLVAFSTHDSNVDEARRSVILSRRASARATRMISASGVAKAQGPVRIPVDDETGTPGRVVYAVRWLQQIVGFLVYVDEQPDAELPGQHSDSLRAAVEELGGLLHARELERRQEEDQVRVLLRQLTSASARDREQGADEALRSRRLSLSAANVALVLTTRLALGGEPLPAMELAALEEGLTAVLRLTPTGAIGSVLYDHAIVIQSRPFDSARLRQRVTELPLIRAGAGDPRATLQAAGDSYREALISARAAWHDPAQYPGLAAWADLGADRLLLQLPLSRLTDADLPTPVRLLLAAGPGPDLAKTLECYLANGCEAQATAKALMIHRSSLYYRLDRVRQITKVDLADGRVRGDLQIGLRTATLCGLRSPKR